MMNTATIPESAPKASPRIVHVLRAFLLLATALLVVAFIVCVITIFIMSGDGVTKGEIIQEIETLHPLVDVVSARAVKWVAMAGALWTLFGGLIVWMIFKMSRSLMDGDPFRPDSLLWMRRLWIALLSFEIVMIFVRPMLKTIIKTGQVDTLQFGVSFQLTNWLFIIIIAALAEVFRHGAQLRLEQQLTV